MGWAKLSDDIPMHEKVFQVGIAAFGLYAAGLCYCNRRLTDGAIPAQALPTLFPGLVPRQTMRLVAKLVEAKLWEKTDDGWQVHDFLDWNPSAKEVLEKRQAKADRMDRWRRASSTSRGASRSPSRGASGDAAPTPTPTPTPLTPLARSASTNTGDDLPPEAFNHDCPPDHHVEHGSTRTLTLNWRGKCVSAPWAHAHPHARVHLVPVELHDPSKGFRLFQCPHHRAKG